MSNANNSEQNLISAGDAGDEEWQQVPLSHNNKRRAQSRSPIPPEKRPNHSNRFISLTDYSDISNFSNNEHARTENTEPKPPPIFIPYVKNVTCMVARLKTVVPENEIFYKATRDDQIRLSIKSVESYRKIIKFLDNHRTSYHTYQLKQERAYRIVLKGLHHSTPLDDIKTELRALGHNVRDIINMKSKATKNPLSMFFVDLEPSINNKDIYNVKHINNAIIKVEMMRKTDDFVQCHRCQEFGHTKNFCKKSHICVKCALYHPSSQCIKPPGSPPRCTHCLQKPRIEKIIEVNKLCVSLLFTLNLLI